VSASPNLSSLPPEIRLAIEAAQEKLAAAITVLNLSGTGAFAEYFLVCSGQSQPQLRAIAEAVEERLDRKGRHLAHREGKSGAEWLLLDYGSFIVHIFSERAREYYNLERLWRNAERLDIPDAAPSHSASTSSSHGEREGDTAHK
jgi:ribosome-associated protein